MAGARVTGNPRLLLVAEAATFAHVARISALRRALLQDFEISAAFDPRYDGHLPEGDRAHLPLRSVPAGQFMAAVNQSHFPYTCEDLRSYVEDELVLLEQQRPDLVVGDFRLTLAISCRIKGIPYAALANGYWTPMCLESLVPPRIPAFRYMPKGLARAVFALLRRPAYRLAATPFNRVARMYGQAAVCGDLLKVYSQGDLSLIVEPQGWIKLKEDGRHFSIGPVSWNSEAPLPTWWQDWDRQRPMIYVSLGSSGDQNQIEKVQMALEDLNVVVIVAGRPEAHEVRGRAEFFFAPFLNSQAVLAEAKLFISNGGSLSLVDALRWGCPVIGIASNFDQVLSMALVERHGVGCLFGEEVSGAEVAAAARSWLNPTVERQRSLETAKSLFSRPMNKSGLVTRLRDLLSLNRPQDKK